MASIDAHSLLESNPNNSVRRGACNILLKLLRNLYENPHEPKFRAVKRNNDALKVKLWPVHGTRELLQAVGFVDTDLDDQPQMVCFGDVDPIKIKSHIDWLLALLEQKHEVEPAPPQSKFVEPRPKPQPPPPPPPPTECRLRVRLLDGTQWLRTFSAGSPLSLVFDVLAPVVNQVFA